MIAVIFRVKVRKPDEEYDLAAARLRELAFGQYGCIDFVSVKEGDQEISISYWEDEESVKEWKRNAEHILAQKSGRSKWYSSYLVQVTEIKREYTHETKASQ